MLRVSSNEILAEIKKEKINFLAFIVTPWAVHGVEAFVEYLDCNHDKIKGYIIIVDHPQAGRMLDEKSLDVGADLKICQLLDKNISFKEIIRGIFRRKKNSIRKFYVLQQGESNYRWHFLVRGLGNNFDVKSVIVDEGLAMYMRDSKAWLKSSLADSRTIKEKTFSVIHIVLKKPFFNKILRRRGEIIQFALLSKCGNKLLVDRTTVEYYVRSIKRKGESYDAESLYKYGGAVIINTQPFYDYGQIKEDEDIKVLRSIYEICDKLNIPIVLKPHPREKDVSRYSVIGKIYIDENKGRTQESILLNLRNRPRAIVGFSSTTLVSAKILTEIPTVSLIDYADWNKFNEIALQDFIRFKATFQGLVALPKKQKDFIDIVGQEDIDYE